MTAKAKVTWYDRLRALRMWLRAGAGVRSGASGRRRAGGGVWPMPAAMKLPAAMTLAAAMKLPAATTLASAIKLASAMTLAAAMLAATPVMWSQGETDGAVGGRFVDVAGRPVAGARISVRHLETGLTAVVKTGARGEFLLVRLPVGRYAVTVELAGVRGTLSGQVEVVLGEVAEVDGTLLTRSGGGAGLRGGGASSAGGGVSSAGGRRDEQETALLPDRGGEESAAVGAAVSAGPAAGPDDNASEVSFRGVAVTQNSTSAEGVSGDQSFNATPAGAGVEEDNRGSDESADRSAGPGAGKEEVSNGGRRAGAAYTYAQAGVREFRVHGQADAAAYGSAIYGHGVGGVVTMASREGGERLHGTVFYTVRDSAWAAANPFSVATSYASGAVTSEVVKPHDLRQQFGGSVGGRLSWLSWAHWLARDASRPGLGFGPTESAGRGDGRGSGPRLFYFYAFDQQRRDFPAVSSPGYAGFYTLTATQTALLANRGVGSAKVMAALNYLSSLTGVVDRQANQTVNFGRLDWHRGGGSRVVGEYNGVRWSAPAGARLSPVVDRGRASLGSSYGEIDSGVGRWVALWAHGLSNEVRVQYGRQLQYEVAQSPLPQEPAVGPGGAPPEVSIGPSGLVFGTPAGLGQRAFPLERRLEGADVLGWVRARHFLQIGGDVSAIRDTTESLTNAEGTFDYDSGATGGKAGGLVDWITDYTFNVNVYPDGGCPSIGAAVHGFCFRAFSQSFGQQSVSFPTQEWAGFAQDDWRVTRGLTLHAGLRYEYEFLPLPQQPNRALDAVFGATGATSVFPEDRNNFGPRLGAVWEPLGVGRGVIRLGWGGYFGRVPGSTIRAALLETAMPGSTTNIRIVPSVVTACPQSTVAGFGYPCAFPATPSGVIAATTSAVVFDRRFRTPEVQQGTLWVEHGVGWGVMARAGYVVNLDRQLPNSVDINIAPSTATKTFQLQGGTGAIGVRDGETFVVPAYSARVSTSFGPVTDVISNANATYNGLTVEAQRGLGGGGGGHGLEFKVGWTWSRAIDFGQSPGGVPRLNGQFDPFQVGYDRGLSALNFPHRVVGSAVWTPRTVSLGRYASENRWLRMALIGWSVAGIFSETSGRGYSYDLLGGTRLAGGRESINGSGGSVVLPTVGRNTLRLPDSTTLDLRLSRSLGLRREGLRVRGTVEVYNAANRVSYSGVTQRAFLAGTPVGGVTPLVFQDAAAVGAEGLNVLPFGAYTAAGTTQAQERRVQLGVRLEF